MKTVAIIQARTGSTRLPAKVMADIEGLPMISRVIQRVQRARRIDQIVVATTNLDGDTQFAEFYTSQQWSVYRGDSCDVLTRYLHASKLAGAANIVRITADCPLVDPHLIDIAVDSLIESNRLDYVSNVCSNRTFPRGLDVEAFRTEALIRADKLASTSEREHVTQVIYRNPDQFSLGSIEQSSNQSEYRWTVDTAEDLELVRAVYKHFSPRDTFSTSEIVAAFKANPGWHQLNSHIQQKVA